MTNPNRPDPATLEAEIIARATRDPEFRRALLTDTRATLMRELSVNLPADVELSVVEETPRHRYLVLPPAADGSLLTEDQLAAVAGGSSYSDTCTNGCN